MSLDAALFCTDEDLATFAPADMALLIPSGQWYARGLDGAFDPGDPWTLRSATVDFAAAMIVPGQFVRVEKGMTGTNHLQDQFIVDDLDGSALILRRVGGILSPPTWAAAGITGVRFQVGSLKLQCDAASYEVAQKIGVNAVYGIPESALVDARQVRQIAAYTVLKRQYYSQANAAGDGRDAFVAKSKQYAADAAELIAGLKLRIEDANQPGGTRSSYPRRGNLVR